MLTDSEKKKKQHIKELHSFRNKMTGSKLIWFDSLTQKKQFDLLFEWKSEKYYNKLQKPEVKFLKRRKYSFFKSYEITKIIEYPPSIKHFTNLRKRLSRYSVRLSQMRNTAIDILLNNK